VKLGRNHSLNNHLSVIYYNIAEKTQKTTKEVDPTMSPSFDNVIADINTDKSF
jgi:hypothetical protein